jgi:putative endonuclease
MLMEPPRTRRSAIRTHFVYIVRCAGGTLYTGYAIDPTARTLVHNSGRGARYTAGRRPVQLVYVEPYRTKNQALRREHQLKRWTRTRKEVLITQQNREGQADRSS